MKKRIAYWQPEFAADGTIVGYPDPDIQIFSFQVWRSKKNLLKEYPKCIPLGYASGDIEKPTFMDNYNITKEKWFVDDGSYHIEGDASEIFIRKEMDGELYDICDMSSDETNFPKDNAKAICTAVNETYGKGYDPAAMDDLYKALDKLQKVASETTKDLVGWDGAEPLDKAIDKAKAALTKAKL